MTPGLALVTGGSGFIAGHTILRLLDQGWRVRTTIRSRRTEEQTRDRLRAAGMVHDDSLSFVEADLLSDRGWNEAVEGVNGVFHLASPIHLARVRDENEVIAPAREGTLRVLRAAHAGGVPRVVLTSAFHAVGFGHGHLDRVFTEDDWSPLHGPGVDAYGRSKILAERAAWDFAGSTGGGLELATMLPVAVMGPVLGGAVSGANQLVLRMLTGKMPAYPDLSIPIVDVRDVAAAHVAAMTRPEAAGQRFLVATGEPAMALHQVAALLRDQFGDAARRVPTRAIPDLVVRLGARLSSELASIAPELGYVKRVSAEKTARVLDVHPRPSAEAVLAAARSMLDSSLVARR